MEHQFQKNKRTPRLNKPLSKKSKLILLTMFAVNLAVYYPSQLFGTVGTPKDISTSLDAVVSFDARWVFIYGLAFVFWAISYATLSRFEGWSDIAAAEMIAKISCIFFFIFLPTTNSRPILYGGSFSETILGLLYTLDKPLNLFPSIHCFDSWICGRCLFSSKHIPTAYRVFALLFSVLVLISVLKTRQHVIIDVIGGVLLAELGLALSRKFGWGRVIDKLFK